MKRNSSSGIDPRRRAVLLGLTAASVGWSMPARAQSASALFQQPAIFGPDVGVIPGLGRDQTATLQKAVDLAAGLGLALFLPGGQYLIGTVRLPAGSVISGLGAKSILVATSSEPVLVARGKKHVHLSRLAIDGNGYGPTSSKDGLLALYDCAGMVLEDLWVGNSGGGGVFLNGVSGTVNRCQIEGCEKTGLFALDSAGLALTDNTIRTCGNGGIRVWRSKSGPDGTLISGNRVVEIDWRDGGNGQNGNGVNIFRADGVIVSDNIFADCAFSAVRVNSANNTQIRGNNCANSGEVAIFSEFAFTGSLIANNIVDGAATGISITNFDSGGRLAVCSGNIVRNIFERSAVNPDTGPVGIFAEADTLITDNIVEAVPGIGIRVGWGPYLRNVLVSNNIVRQTRAAIAVSVAPKAGTATIRDNLIAAASEAAIIGMAWDKLISADLARDAANYPNLDISGNRVTDESSTS